MKKIIMISVFLMFSFNNLIVAQSCGEVDNMTIDDILRLEPEGYDNWTRQQGFVDGVYYEATVIFSDGVRGKLYKGESSGRFFVEDASGNNYYYSSLR